MNKKLMLYGLLLIALMSFVSGQEGQNTTYQEALDAINESESIVSQMRESELPTLFMNDTLIIAKRTLQQAQFAELLREGSNATEREKQEARQALRLLDWEAITYDSVILHTDKIEERRKKILELSDILRVREMESQNYYGSLSKLNTPYPRSVELLEAAKISFKEDRLEEAEGILEQSREALELERSESATLNTLQENTKNFVQKNWPYLMLAAIIAAVVIYGTRKFVNKKLLKKKIRKMKAEQNALRNLIKKAQIDRFKKNKISSLVYNIRVKKYNERAQKIKEQLPVLEKNLKR